MHSDSHLQYRCLLWWLRWMADTETERVISRATHQQRTMCTIACTVWAPVISGRCRKCSQWAACPNTCTWTRVERSLRESHILVLRVLPATNWRDDGCLAGSDQDAQSGKVKGITKGKIRCAFFAFKKIQEFNYRRGINVSELQCSWNNGKDRAAIDIIFQLNLSKF